MLSRRAFFVTCLLSSAAARAVAQDTRSVTGVVTDHRGNPLEGAAVEIENTRTLEIASYLTGKDGRYYFHQLSTGIDFTVRAKYKRWWSKDKLLNRLNSSRHATIDLTVPVE